MLSGTINVDVLKYVIYDEKTGVKKKYLTLVFLRSRLGEVGKSEVKSWKKKWRRLICMISMANS